MIASICGIGSVVPMEMEQQQGEKRDAMLVPDVSGGRSIIYNPTRPAGRVAFSIAHRNFLHLLFPSSIKGARFRNICASDSKEANELETLCNLGASELLMPIEDFQRAAASTGYSLAVVPAMMERFGSSFEATVFRLASAHPGVAVAGLLQYRLQCWRAAPEESGTPGVSFFPHDGGPGRGNDTQVSQTVDLSVGILRRRPPHPLEQIIPSRISYI